ncbi:MAG: prephenate dehydratase [Ignavibacteriales bacterium]|nr:prephenate dehydratase [Ignavibacteriales bacterium]
MISVAFQGEPGAFSEQAARSFFRTRVQLIPCRHFKDVFRFAARGGERRGIVPIENSVFGSVHETYDLLIRHWLFIGGEITLRVHHHLMAMPRVRTADLRFVFSHPQALGQCEQFLRTLKNARQIPYYDTAGAAKMIREEGRMNAGALASRQAAKVYRLRILRRNVESNHQNYTRFIVLSKKATIPSGRPKTSLAFAAENVPGALFRALGVFALRDINLIKIESRPVAGKPWEYLFYVDVTGHSDDAPLKDALHHLDEVSTFVRVLGSYSVGRTVQG